MPLQNQTPSPFSYGAPTAPQAPAQPAPTAAPQAPSAPQTSSPQPDVQALALTKAIAQNETGGDYTAVGDNGTSTGAYQYQPATWAAYATQILGNPNAPMTPANQNAVTYGMVKTWKDQGMGPAQILAAWNAGQSKALDGTWANNVGTMNIGGKQISYDTPTYVKNGIALFQKIYPQVQAQYGGAGSPVSVAPTASAATSGASSSQSPSLGGFLGNIVSSAGNVLGGLGNAVMHPVQTVENLGNTVQGAAENASNVVLGTKFNDTSTQTANAVGQYFAQRYGGSNPQQIAQNILTTAYKDPVGVALDLSTLLDGVGAGVGLAGKISDLSDVAKAGDLSNVSKVGEVTPTLSPLGKIGQTIGKAGNAINPINPLISAAKGVVNLGTRAAGEASGIATGAGYGSIAEAYNAAKAGDESLDALTQGLRSGATPEDIVDQAKDALAQVTATRAQTYQAMLEGIKGDSTEYDISPVQAEFQKQLANFNITDTKDGLDFSRSPITDPGDATIINKIQKDIESWGSKPGDTTAAGINTLKRRLGSYYSKNSNVRSFVTNMAKSAKSTIANAPGYTAGMAKYAEDTDNIEEIQKGLSLGDKALRDTAFKKLTSSLRQNNEARTTLVKALDSATGGKLLPKIAGQQLSSLIPRGLAKFEDVGALGGILTGHAILPLIASMVTTSPRIVGEFVRAAGLTAGQLEKVGVVLGKIVPPAKVTSVLNIARDTNSNQPAR